MASKTGTVLLFLGLALLLAWVALIFLWSPLEEPVSPTRLPNPSEAPWYYDPAAVPRKDRLLDLAVKYGWPGLGVLFLMVGGFLLTARRALPDSGFGIPDSTRRSSSGRRGPGG
jgi:hypothetical protein